ncbi:MAG: hypothetical protein FJ146_07360 [Deltaproteobacteria bacterium]|nr:hypothetical protein [Deltaproteobacteria bacterium]
MTKDRSCLGSKLAGLLALTLAILGPDPAGAATAVYRYIDVARQAHDGGRGIEVLGAYWQSVHQYAKNLRFTDSAKKAYEMVNDIIQTVDFQAFLTSHLALVTPDGARVFLLKGATASDALTVDYEKARLGSYVPARPFDFAAEISVRADAKPIPQVKRGFVIGAQVAANAGELSHRTMLRSLDGIMQVLEPQNVARLPVEAGGQNLTLLARKARGEVLQTLPDTIKYLERYQKINFEPKIEQHKATGKEFTRVHLSMAIDIPAVERDYPDLAHYLDRLITSFDLNIGGRYQLPNGLSLFNFTFNSETSEINLELVTADGAVIPVDDKGQPHAEAALHLAELQSHSGLMVINARGGALGLEFDLHDLHSSFDFKEGPVMHSGGRIVSLPPPKVTGRALGIFPTWAIDLSIPGSIDEYATMITQGILKGANGKGTYLRQTVDTRDPKATKVTVDMGTMLVDNFFVNFGMRVVQKFVWPSEDVLGEMRQALVDFSGHVANDLVRLSVVPADIAH